MELKAAYSQALKEEVQPLIDAGKITLLGTLEELVEDLAEAMFKGLKKGAVLSSTTIDDMLVPPAVSLLEVWVAPHIDKIDGKQG